MTTDELQALLAPLVPGWRASEWGAFLSASEEEQQALADGLRLSMQGAPTDPIKTALDLLEGAAGLVPGFGGGIATGIKVLRGLVGQ